MLAIIIETYYIVIVSCNYDYVMEKKNVEEV